MNNIKLTYKVKQWRVKRDSERKRVQGENWKWNNGGRRVKANSVNEYGEQWEMEGVSEAVNGEAWKWTAKVKGRKAKSKSYQLQVTVNNVWTVKG